ncbi:SLAM family member 5-like isoform X2 [Vanacampus margaritifer]
MVAGGLSCILCYGSAWLMLAILQEVPAEVPACQRVIRPTGDTVELPSCLPAEDVTFARWSYQGIKVASLDGENVHVEAGRFAGRLRLNHRNFSLTLRAVTLEDSGVFSFVSAVNDSQRETVQVTLEVYEPITAEPVLRVNVSRHAANRSCGILLHCSASDNRGPLDYIWRVGNRSQSGAWHRLSVPLWAATTHVTCTVSNAGGVKSASISVTCTNDTASSAAVTETLSFGVVVSAATGAFCVLVMVAAISVLACRRRRRLTSGKSEEATVYADISDTALEYASVRATEPHSTTPSVPVQTFYDKIQLNRMTMHDHAP